MSDKDCEKCNQLEKELAILKTEFVGFQKQYIEDRLADQEDMKEVDEGLDTLLKKNHTLDVLKQVATVGWKLAVGMTAFIWCVLQIIGVFQKWGILVIH